MKDVKEKNKISTPEQNRVFEFYYLDFRCYFIYRLLSIVHRLSSRIYRLGFSTCRSTTHSLHKQLRWNLHRTSFKFNMTRHRGQRYLCEFVYNLCEFIHNLSLSKITSYNTFTTLLLGLRLSASFTWLLTKYVQLVCQTNHLSIYSHNF